MSRDLDIRVTAARDAGFIVWEAGDAVAALANPQELAMWIEQRAMQVEGEMQRAQDETGEAFPNVIRTDRKAWFRRGG